MTQDWNAVASAYARVKETRRDTVFNFVHKELQKLRPQHVLDFGCGDGVFSTICVDLPVIEIVNYDPADAMVDIARRMCAHDPRIRVVRSLDELAASAFDVVTMNAVWMCLPTHRACLDALAEIRKCLKPGGVLISSITHPCFRQYAFSTYETDFDPKNYLKDGEMFNVRIFDSVHEVSIVDTHWSLSAVSTQLRESGFTIQQITELPDLCTANGIGVSPWMVLTAA